MKKSGLKKLSLAVAVSTTLVGCGGGGGGSETAPAPAPIEFDQSYVSGSDKGVIALTGSFGNPNDVTITQTPDIGVSLASVSGSRIELSIPDLDRPVTTVLQITVDADGREVTKQVSLLANNSDAEPDVEKARAAIEQGSSLLDLEQDSALYTFFIDYAYLAKVISHSEKQSLLAEFDPESEATYSNLQVGLTELNSVLEDYQSAEAGEDRLRLAIEGVASAISDHSVYGVQRLDAISEYTEILVPGFVDRDIEYDERLGIWSAYTKGSYYGDVIDNQFVARAAFEPIEPLIQDELSQSLTCEVL
jgi:hypothetical protein